MHLEFILMELTAVVMYIGVAVEQSLAFRNETPEAKGDADSWNRRQVSLCSSPTYSLIISLSVALNSAAIQNGIV